MADNKLSTDDKRLLLKDWIANLDEEYINELFKRYVDFLDYR